MAKTTYGSISQRTAAWAAVEMLSHAEPIVVLQKLGMPKPMPKNKADTVKFRRAIPFVAATTALTEGVTPTAQSMSYQDVSVQLAQYGALVEITDRVNDLSEDPVLKNATQLCGEQIAETTENIAYGVIKAGTNVSYNNGTQRTDVNTAISLNKIRGCVRTLMSQRAKMITDILAPSVQISTRYVEPGYVAVCHTDLIPDIRNLSGFLPVAAYGTRKVIDPMEIGSVENVRFIASPLFLPFADAGGAAGGTMVSTTGTSADVYPVVILAREAFGIVTLKGASAVTPRVINPDDVDKSDPLGQRGYVSWKTYYACVRLNENWMVRLECAATAL